MRKASIVLVSFGVLTAIASTPALSHEPPSFIEQSRCWLGSLSYSPGATARAGNVVMVCGPDFAWTVTGEWAAGCLHNGAFYSVGAIQNASNQQQLLSECQPDGTWGRVAVND